MKNFYKLIILMSLLCIMIVNVSNTNKYDNFDNIVSYNENSLSLKDSILLTILISNIEHPDIVFAQAILETGNFTSRIFQENNNLFGMKMPKIRKTCAIKEQYNHALFNSWYESIYDYKIWQDTYASNKTREEYFEYLKNNYSEDKNYIQKIKNIIDKNNIKIDKK